MAPRSTVSVGDEAMLDGRGRESSAARGDAHRHELVAGMRRFYWQLRWRNARGIVGKGPLAARMALLPIVALKHAWHGTRTYGANVAKVAGVAPWRQFLHLAAAVAQGGQDWDAYYRYRLYRFADARSTGLFISLPMNIALREHLCDRLGVDRSRLADKRKFHRTCMTHGLPTARTVIDVEGGTVTWWPGFEAQRLPSCDLFSKEANNIKGRGAARWFWLGDGRYRDEDGASVTAGELIEHLRARSRTAPYLLQVRVANHPSIARIAPETLCTVRVVTYRRHPDADPALLAAVFRMAGGPFPADNFSQRGLASRVDEATGELGPALFKELHDTAVDHTVHPVFGTPISGFRLPYWAGVVDLALHAHRLFGEFQSIGWDVAITPDGPLLLEGNYNWNPVLIQQPGGRPLGETDFAASYFSWLEHANGTAARKQDAA